MAGYLIQDTGKIDQGSRVIPSSLFPAWHAQWPPNGLHNNYDIIVNSSTASYNRKNKEQEHLYPDFNGTYNEWIEQHSI
jgi:hypothetical protein